MSRFVCLLVVGCFLSSLAVFEGIFGAVRGVVHDPQHRPVQGATVTLTAKTSDWTKSAATDSGGEFQFNAVPLGQYSVSVTSPGFVEAAQSVTVISGTVPVVHFGLKVMAANTSVTVS